MDTNTRVYSWIQLKSSVLPHRPGAVDWNRYTKTTKDYCGITTEITSCLRQHHVLASNSWLSLLRNKTYPPCQAGLHATTVCAVWNESVRAGVHLTACSGCGFDLEQALFCSRPLVRQGLINCKHAVAKTSRQHPEKGNSTTLRIIIGASGTKPAPGCERNTTQDSGQSLDSRLGPFSVLSVCDPMLYAHLDFTIVFSL